MTHSQKKLTLGDMESRDYSRAGNGFTLIELLVVIAIMATLTALLFSVGPKVRADALNAKALSNFRQLLQGERLYAIDNDGCFTRVYTATDSQPMSWQPRLMPYVGYPGVSTGTDKIVMNPSTVFNVPESKPASQRSFYASSIAMNGSVFETTTPPWNYRAANVTAPSEVVLFVEIVERGTDYIGKWTSGPGNGLAFRAFNKTRCRVGFCDGHADALTAEQMNWDPVNGKIKGTIDTPPWGFR